MFFCVCLGEEQLFCVWSFRFVLVMHSFVVCAASAGFESPSCVSLCFGDVRLYVFSFAAVGLSPPLGVVILLIVAGALPHYWVRSLCTSSCSSFSLTARKAVFVVEQRAN